MNVRAVGLAVLMFGVAALADDTERAKLMGAWESESGTDHGSSVIWLLEAKGGVLHIANLQGSQKLAEFECDTNGKECATKVSGRAAKISLWFNGPKLVELETKGSEVVKRRFAISGAGEEMDVEIIPIVSESKAETVHFKRAKAAPSNK
jgi:hypothetical protein